MRIEDELEIRNLIARVARLTDQWDDLAVLSSNYTADCVWHLEGVEPYHGRAGIARRAQEMLDAGVCGPGTPMRHIVSTPEVIFDDAAPDQATVISFVAMADKGAQGAFLKGYGQYTDTLRKEDGRWLIAKRYGVAFW